RVDVAAGEVDLVAGNAGERAGGSPDLGREVRQRADVVAEDRRRVGELSAGELHTVAGVTAEADGNVVNLLDLWRALATGRIGGRIGYWHDRNHLSYDIAPA